MLKDKNLRTRRLFRNNGRSLVIAMDHARVFDTVTGLKNITKVVEAVRAGGADSILTPWGSTMATAEALDGGGCWLSVDVTPQSITSTVERSWAPAPISCCSNTSKPTMGLGSLGSASSCTTMRSANANLRSSGSGDPGRGYGLEIVV